MQSRIARQSPVSQRPRRKTRSGRGQTRRPRLPPRRSCAHGSSKKPPKRAAQQRRAKSRRRWASPLQVHVRPLRTRRQLPDRWDSLVSALQPSLECLKSVSTIGERCVDSVQWLAMVCRNLREREREAVATASSSKHESWSRMPGHRDEKSLGGSRDLQEARSDLAVRSSRIDKYADDRALCSQKIDDLGLWLNWRPTTVDPDGKAVPGNRLLQRSRCRPVVTDRKRHEVTWKIAEYADAVEFVRVPGKADNRSRPLLE